MRRKFLSVVLCVCMMLTMAPFAFAEGETEDVSGSIGVATGGSSTGASGSSDAGGAVAKIGETTYNTLQDAINNATGDTTITLLKDVNLSSDATLDLSGKTIKTDGNTIRVNSGTLTVTGNGDIQNDCTGVKNDNTQIHALFHVADGAILNITNGTFKSASYQLLDVAGICNIDTASFECTVENNTYDSYSIISVCGEHAQLNFKSGSVTMKKSNVPSDGMYGIYASKGGSVTLGDSETKEGPTITSHFAALGINHETSPSTWNIYGGTYTSTAKASTEWWKYFCGAMYLAGNCEVNIYGGTFNGGNYTFSMPWADADVKLTINGGTFNETDGDGILYFRKNTATETKTSPSATINSGTFNGTLVCGDKDVKDVAVTGGTFNPDCNPTYKAVATVDGKAYTSLASAIAVADGKTVQLISNTTENVTIPSGKSIILDLNGQILSGGTVDSKAAITNNGTITIQDTSSSQTGKIIREDNGAKGYYTIDNQGTMTIKSGIVYNSTGNMPNGSSLIRNAGNNVAATLNITGGNIKQDGFIAVKNDDHGILNVSGGKITTTGDTITNTASAIQNWCTANITGGTINGAIWTSVWSNDLDNATTTIENATVIGRLICKKYDEDGSTPPASKTAKTIIKSGDFDISSWTVGNDCSVEISGGYFTSDPTAYVASGYAAKSSKKADYAYMVAKKENNEVIVKPAVATPNVTLGSDIDNAKQEAVKASAQSVKVPEIANAAAKNVSISSSQAEQYIKEANLTSSTGQEVILYVQSFLDVTPTAYDENSKTYTLDITPKYQIIASTATTADKIKLPSTAGDTANTNAVVVKEDTVLNVTEPTQVSLTLPTSFVTVLDNNPTIYVKHVKDNGKTYIYTASLNGNTLTFTNPHGFSEFTVTTTAPVATVDGIGYKSLQDAVDAAANRATIVLNSGTSHTLNLNTTKSVTVKNNTGDKTTITFNGTAKEIDKDGTETFTYTRPSSGGPGSSGGSISTPTTYAVNVNAATNGAVAADKKTAAKGTTVTVTASPSKGYVVDAVKVVDKDGKDVAVTGKDGKYVFTMPGSAVTVTGTFKAETPVALPFTDVKSGDWFYPAVQYAYAQGLMTGTSATTFAPNGTMNRAMIVTVLYRLEKSPAVTGASKFTDVPAGQWYSDAVAWAAANKIVNGYDETTFGPMNAVTREQMAAILFRYEQYKGLENVTLEENLNRFPDQNKISAYAIPALQWAVGQKIINGNADGTLDPTGTATRAQVAQIFTNLLNK